MRQWPPRSQQHGTLRSIGIPSEAHQVSRQGSGSTRWASPRWRSSGPLLQPASRCMQALCVATYVAAVNCCLCPEAAYQFTQKKLILAASPRMHALRLQTQRRGQRYSSTLDWLLLRQTSQIDRTAHLSRQGLSICNLVHSGGARQVAGSQSPGTSTAQRRLRGGSAAAH